MGDGRSNCFIALGRATQNAISWFSPLVRRAFQQVIAAKLTETLDKAKAFQQGEVEAEGHSVAASSGEVPNEQPDNRGIVTTAEELQAFYIVRAIGAEIVPTDRIAMRDCLSYCGILLDDNNRKPIVRLHFDMGEKKQIGLLDAQKNETKHAINGVDDIYKFADAIKEAIRRHDGNMGA